MQKHFYLVTLGCHQISNLCCWIFPFDFLLMFWHEENSEKAKESKQEKKKSIEKRQEKQRRHISDTNMQLEQNSGIHTGKKKKSQDKEKETLERGKKQLRKKRQMTQRKKGEILY